MIELLAVEWLSGRNLNGLIATVGACLVASLLLWVVFSWDGTPVRNREDWSDERSPNGPSSSGDAGFGGVGGDGVSRRSR